MKEKSCKVLSTMPTQIGLNDSQLLCHCYFPREARPVVIGNLCGAETQPALGLDFSFFLLVS